jgi:hypothetical protein
MPVLHSIIIVTPSLRSRLYLNICDSHYLR